MGKAVAITVMIDSEKLRREWLDLVNLYIIYASVKSCWLSKKAVDW